MPKAYSRDLREKAIAAIERGVPKSEVITMFNISRDSLDRWLKRRSETGSVVAIQGYQHRHSHCIVDWERFRAFVKVHGDKTQAELAELWHEPISARTISRALAKIGFTRKKRSTATVVASLFPWYVESVVDRSPPGSLKPSQSLGRPTFSKH